MPKSSKQTSGKFSSIGSVPHASPVLSNTLKTAGRAIPSLKVPSLIDSLRQVEDVPVKNSEVITPTNSNNKIFTVQTGLSELEPTIVLSSEFLPLYDSGIKTSQGTAVSIKEGSKILNAKTAIAVLSQSIDSRSAFDNNKNDIKKYVEEEQSFITGLTTNLNLSLGSLNVTSYSSNHETAVDPFALPVSLKSILINCGYRSLDIDQFTQTKLWHQALVETKRTLLTHSPSTLSMNYLRGQVHNDVEPYEISDVNETPSNLKRLWINPYIKNVIDESSLRSSIETNKNVSFLSKYENVQFVNLKYANSLEKKILGVSGNVKLGQNVSGETENLFFSHEEIRKLVRTGKDISFLYNVIVKEALMSSYLTKKENSDNLLNRIGYAVNRSGDNFSVWDYLIGRVPKNILEFYKTPLGNGNSLISFSQDIVVDGNDNYRILTFENEYLEGTNTTPGSYYYVESSLNSIDGNKFDISRLDDLIKKTDRSVETIKTIVDLAGYDSFPLFYSNNQNSNGENYFRRTPAPDLSLSSLIEKFSIVSRTYSKCFRMTESGIERLDTASMRPGLNFTQEETSGIRLASLICKTAVYPEKSFEQDSQKIKSLLFLWLMNTALGQINGDTDSSHLEDLKKRISDLFSRSTIRVNSSDLQKATDEFRTVPMVIGSAPYIGDVPDIQVQVDYGTLEEMKSWISSIDPGILLIAQVSGDPGGEVKVTVSTRDTVFVDTAEEERNSFLQKALDLIRQYREYKEEESRQQVAAAALAERRQAYNIYSLSAVGRLFNIDENKGVWRLIVESIKSVYSNSDLYFENLTAYSGMSKMYYMYTYFDLLLRIVASQTPERLLGVYSGTYEYKSAISFVASEDNPDKNYYEDGIVISETGFLIDKTTKDQLNDHFVMSQSNFLSPSALIVRKLADTSALILQEEKDEISGISFFKKYFLDLSSNLNKFRTFLLKNLQQHLDRMNGLYQGDTSIDSNTRSALLSLSFTRDQLRLTNYVMSEFSDRLSESNDISSKLKSHPSFSSFVDNFIDFMPINETEIVSHSLLSSYFTSNELGRNKGNNKKIISVGLPPNLARSLVLTPYNVDSSTSMRNSIIRLKIYKNDRLHPDVVYQPKTYLFEMGRFPTRVISNWDFDSLSKGSSNILTFPTKLSTPDNRILLHKDYTVAFPEEIYGSFLNEKEKLEIYANHVISFLFEEYLRWFTDCRFDETRYNNYSQLTSTLETMENQFLSYIEFVKRNSSSSIVQQTSTPTTNGISNVSVTYTDPDSGNTYQIPVKTPNSSVLSQNQSKEFPRTSKNYVLPMDDTIKMYFMNETFLTDVNVFKKRISYPKKFDRVFNVIVDPDDFYVDMSMTDSATLESLVDLGVLTKVDLDSSGKIAYKHRDTSPQDVSLCEYFSTIEPYDYITEDV